MTSDPEHDASTRLLSLLAGKWISQAVSTAAEIGISDALREKPLSVEELAEALGCHAPTLERLMYILVGEGLYAIDEGEEVERYRLDEMGALLCEHQEQFRDLARFIGSPTQWAPWSALPDCVRSGKSAYEHTHGQTLYSWLEAHPEDAKRYDRGIDRFTADVSRAIAGSYDFARVHSLVDVGGGLGSSLIEILDRWPEVRGTLFELPHVLERAERRLAGYKERCELVAGSFFEPISSGADVYLLKHVLHNWGDEDALKILKQCREAMRPDSTLLIVEGLLVAGHGRSFARLMDLEMLVLFGQGRERTKREMQLLCKEAGLHLERRTLPLDAFARLLIAHPR